MTHKPKPESGELEFDENKSQASMPRLYEHIDRVDLWVMAQQQYHNAAARQVEELRGEIERLTVENHHDYIQWLLDENDRLSAAIRVLREGLEAIASHGYVGNAEADGKVTIAKEALK